MAGNMGSPFSSSSSSDDEMFSGINVTPLVDVVLVLLITFMITAPVIYQSAIQVQLPKAKTAQQASKNKMNFAIDKLGNLAWGDEKIQWPTLTERLKTLESSEKEETAMISADEATPHGMVIKLMDALRSAGLNHFALNVESVLDNHTTNH